MNHVRNGPGDTMEGSNAAAWQCYTSKNVLFEHCTALDAWAGYYAKNWMNGVTVRNCFAGGGILQPFYGMPYNGTTWQDGDAHVGNLLHIIENCVAEGVWEFFEGDVADRAADMIVRGNTIVFHADAANVSGQAKYSNPMGASDPFLVDFYNNLMAYRGGTSNQHRLNSDCPPASSMFGTLDYNAYPTTGFSMEGADGSFFSTMATWRTHVGGGREAGSITTDAPLFVTGTGQTPANYRLQGGSPCIGAGRVGGVSGGAAVNMGAYGSSDQSEQIGHNFALLPES